MNEFLRRMNLDLPTLVERLRAVFRSPIVTGVLVDLEVLNTATTGTAIHTLGRAYVGAVPVRSTDHVILAVLPATDTATITVTLDAPTIADVTITLWVF